jgi:hypothetical protein
MFSGRQPLTMYAIDQATLQAETEVDEDRTRKRIQGATQTGIWNYRLTDGELSIQ